MSEISCLKCEKTAEMITDNLFLGKLEQEIKNNGLQRLLGRMESPWRRQNHGD